jgi:hypothetical protein
MPTSSGYSGTPLAKKLGIGPSMHVLLLDAPDEYHHWLEPLPEHVVFQRKVGPNTRLVHLFVKRKEDLDQTLHALRKTLDTQACVWVSWPKKASKVPTTVTEDVVREVALPLGFVDIKVCAVSDIWSGLKLVVRKELR